MSDEPLPDITMGPRDAPPPGASPVAPKRKRVRWSWLSTVCSTALLLLVGPLVVGLAVWITDSIGNQPGALAMLAGGALVILAQLGALALAVVGFLTRDPRSNLGIATFLIGALVLAAMGLLVFAAVDDLI